MPPLTFQNPDMLWLAAGIPFTAVLTLWLGGGVVSLPRRGLSALLRSAALGALAVHLAGPAIRAPRPAPGALVFCLDLSESLTERARQDALARIDALQKQALAGDPGLGTALIGFAGDARVLVPLRPGPLAIGEEETARIFLPQTLAELRLALEGKSRGRGPGRDPGTDPGRDDRLRAAGDALERWRGEIDPDRSDPSRALALARTLVPPGAPARAVVLTDGRFDADPRSVPWTAPAASPWRIVVVPLDDRESPEVLVRDVRAPEQIRVGEPFDLQVVLDATAEGRGRITMSEGTRALEDREVRWPAGSGRVVPFTNLRLPEGNHILHLTLSAAPDTQRANNDHLVFVQVRGRPRVLIVEGEPGAGNAIAKALAVQEVQVDSKPAGTAAWEALDDPAPDALVLAGVLPETLGLDAVAAIRRHVEDEGRALIVVASPRYAGRTPFSRTPLDPVLPARLLPFDRPPDAPADDSPAAAPPPTAQAPPAKAPPPKASGADPKSRPAEADVTKITLLLVIDKSGSMVNTPIRLAKEAAIASAETLAPEDTFGVIAFDGEPFHGTPPQPALELTAASQKDLIRDRISRIVAGGGTDVFKALLGAYQMLKAPGLRTPIRHVVLLTDGLTDIADFKTLVTRMTEDGITISTVCIAAMEFDNKLLGNIAQWGKGRNMITSDYREIPQIFTHETQTLVRAVRGSDAPPTAAKPPPPAKAPDAPPPAAPPTEPPKTATKSDTPKPDPRKVRRKDGATFLRGLPAGDLPAVLGLVPAEAKREASTVLVAEGLRGGAEEPLLIVGRSGLGRVAVWTSDLSGEWTPEWVRWEPLPRLLAQVIRDLAGTPGAGQVPFRARTSRDGADIRLAIDFFGAEDPSRIPAAVGLIGEADGPRLVPLRPTGPTGREAKFRPEKTGKPYTLVMRYPAVTETEASGTRATPEADKGVRAETASGTEETAVYRWGVHVPFGPEIDLPGMDPDFPARMAQIEEVTWLGNPVAPLPPPPGIPDGAVPFGTVFLVAAVLAMAGDVVTRRAGA